jgi:hypothetical protein
MRISLFVLSTDVFCLFLFIKHIFSKEHTDCLRVETSDGHLCLFLQWIICDEVLLTHGVWLHSIALLKDVFY